MTRTHHSTTTRWWRWVGLVLAVGLCLPLASCMHYVPFSKSLGPGRYASGGEAPRFALHSTPVRPPYGFIFTDYAAPLDYSFGNHGMGTPATGLRSGTSEEAFGIVLWPLWSLGIGLGDASIESAARNGGLSTIHYADYEYFSVLLIYGRFTVTVYGE